MSSSKFADLEDVDFGAPDVYETSPASPRRRGGRRGDYSESSDEDDEDEDDDSGGDVAGRGKRGARDRGKKSPQAEANPDIERVPIDADKAMERFRDATGLDGRGVDFSPAIHRRRKKEHYYPPPSTAIEATRYELGFGNGYRATSGDENGEEGFHEVAKKPKESPLDRLRRLRMEMDEVETELQSAPSSSGSKKGGSEGDDGQDATAVAPATLLGQLKSLRGQLGQLDERASQAADVGLDAAASQKWEREARKLLESLSSISIDSRKGTSSNAQAADEGGQVAKAGQVDGEGVKMASLDRRLAGLEDLVGIRDAAQDEAKSLARPLMPSLARIEHLLTLLTHPRHLDGISRRVKVLVSELERVHEARRKLDASSSRLAVGAGPSNGLDGATSPLLGAGGSPPTAGGLSPETLTKLEAGLALLSRLETLMPLAPTLLSRLHSLSSLHASAAGFSDDVSELFVAAKTSETTHDELKVVLSNVEGSLRENQQRVKANLESVEARIEGLAKRIEKLS